MSQALCETHQDDYIMGICMQTKCEHKSRLICFTCSITEHSQHTKNILRLTDIQQSALSTAVWPRAGVALDAKKFIEQVDILTSHDCLERVDKFFKEFSENVLEQIENARQQVHKRIQKLTVNVDSQSLKDMYYGIYDFAQINALLESLISHEIKENEFGEFIQDYLQNLIKPETTGIIENILTGSEENITFSVDFGFLQNQMNDFRPLLREIPDNMVSNDGVAGLQFIALTNNAQTDGQEFTFTGTYGAMVCSEPLKKGQYVIEMEVLSQFGCGYFGIIPEEFKDQTQSQYGKGPYKCLADGCQNYTTNVGGVTLESEFKIGGILVVTIDFKNDLFEFGWKGGQAQYTNNQSQFTLQDKTLRFYLQTYTSNNGKVKIVKSKRSY